jgi:hypothetical protein
VCEGRPGEEEERQGRKAWHGRWFLGGRRGFP